MEEKEKNDDIIEAKVSSDDGKQKNRRVEIVLIIIIACLLGVMIKTESLKRIAIGFDDYKTITGKQGYDIEKIEKELLAKKKKATEEAQMAAENAKNQAENSATDGNDKKTEQK